MFPGRCRSIGRAELAYFTVPISPAKSIRKRCVLVRNESSISLVKASGCHSVQSSLTMTRRTDSICNARTLGDTGGAVGEFKIGTGTPPVLTPEGWLMSTTA